MRLKTKKIILFLNVLVLLATTSGAIAGAVILHPGYITGTITVTGETVIGGKTDAYSIPSGFDGHDYNAPNGEYFVTVEGDYNYKVTSEAYITADFPSYNYQSIVSMGRKDTYVGVGDTIENFNFTLDPGYIAPVVTVTGGNIQRMSFYANTNFDPIELTPHYASHSIYGKNVWDPELGQWVFHYLDGMTSFPMKPWVCYDANGDGDYYDSGESYLGVYGYVLSLIHI